MLTDSHLLGKYQYKSNQKAKSIMSSQRGNVSRTRKQKHTNTISYKNNKHGETPKTKALNSLQICNVCSHCKDVLEWKIKYNKYKMLSAPAKCTKCQEKTVKQAYSILCQPCAEKLELCAKCGKKEEIVCRPEPTVAEKAQMEAKFQMELKSLSERKRRTFLRYLDRLGKAKDEDDGEIESGETKRKPTNWMEEAEKRLELLKLRVEKDGEDDDDEEDDDWDDFGSPYEDLSDIESS